MTTAVLTRTLDEELQTLLTGENDACPVCGGHVDLHTGWAGCDSCESVLGGVEPFAGQLELAHWYERGARST